MQIVCKSCTRCLKTERKIKQWTREPTNPITTICRSHRHLTISEVYETQYNEVLGDLCHSLFKGEIYFVRCYAAKSSTKRLSRAILGSPQPFVGEGRVNREQDFVQNVFVPRRCSRVLVASMRQRRRDQQAWALEVYLYMRLDFGGAPSSAHAAGRSRMKTAEIVKTMR